MAFILKSDRKETQNKTIRFPVDVVEDIEKAIIGKDVSYSGFVIQACRYALKEIDKEKRINNKLIFLNHTFVLES